MVHVQYVACNMPAYMYLILTLVCLNVHTHYKDVSIRNKINDAYPKQTHTVKHYL